MAKISSRTEKTTGPSAQFITMALDMSWRLAIAVLVPLVGGFELDKKLDTGPLLTILGFVGAMAGFGLVLWRTVETANNAAAPQKENKA